MVSSLKLYLKKRSPDYLFRILQVLYKFKKKLKRAVLFKKESFPEGAVVIADKEFSYFFGYYDKSPFCPKDPDLLILHRTKSPINDFPSSHNRVDIIIWSISKGQVVKELGQSQAWNWQQGSKAMWLDGKRWCFNTYSVVDRCYKTVIGHLENDEVFELPFPIQDTDHRNYIYSLDYSVLSILRPDYGYFCFKPTSASMSNSKVMRLSLNPKVNETATEILSSKDLKDDASSRISKEIKKYKINHFLVSPSGKSALFVFRYYVGERRYTDLYSLDLVSGFFKVLVPDKGVSHYFWIDDKRFVYTGKGTEDSDGFGHYIYDLVLDESACLMLSQDGHPHVINERSFLTDTYPDSCGFKKLIKVEIYKNEIQAITLIGEFLEPDFIPSMNRCDLHPSVSLDGRLYQVDSVVDGRRAVVVGFLD